jgi:hypothetical protein
MNAAYVVVMVLMLNVGMNLWLVQQMIVPIHLLIILIGRITPVAMKIQPL